MSALYLWYDADHILLYVGITDDLAARQTSHAKRSAWSVFADHAKVLHFATRKEAEAAEQRLVRKEKPLFNRDYNDAPGARQRLVEYLSGKGRLDLLGHYRYAPAAASKARTAAAAVAPAPAGHVVRFADRLVVAGVQPGRYLCTARNTKGNRCKLVLDLPAGAGWATVLDPQGREVRVFDLSGVEDHDRWRAQRCVHHWPAGVPFVDPDWLDYSPEPLLARYGLAPGDPAQPSDHYRDWTAA